MLTSLFFPALPSIRVARLWRADNRVHLAVTTVGRHARCPGCGRRSRWVRSAYQRTLADVPCGGVPVLIHLRVRRFACRVPWCRRRIFAEQMPLLAARYARRTVRLRQQITTLGCALGGEAGARYAASTTPVSANTILRLVRTVPRPPPGAVRVLGVDDFALRRGQRYGTVLVDLERHRLVDLLPDRTADTLAAWLREHPEVEVISRDRAGAYAEGAHLGAPQARQVADRFHLVKNVTDALERYLTHQHAALRQAAARPTPAAADAAPAHEDAAAPDLPLPPETPPAERRPAPGCSAQEWQVQQARRTRRLTRYEEVVALHRAGQSTRAIAAQTGLARGTVRRFLAAGAFPERQPRAPGPTALAPFLPYLRARWAAGCHNATRLWAELCARGFRGGRTIVARAVHEWRLPQDRRRDRFAGGGVPRRATVDAAPTYSSRQTCWLLLRPAAALDADERVYLARLFQVQPKIALAQALVCEFRTLLTARDVPALYSWLHGVEAAGIPDLAAVARGIWRDRQAVEAAVTEDWSNGQTEGFVNKIKLCKRAMFGRAHLDLLRCRLLRAA